MNLKMMLLPGSRQPATTLCCHWTCQAAEGQLQSMNRVTLKIRATIETKFYICMDTRARTH